MYCLERKSCKHPHCYFFFSVEKDKKENFQGEDMKGTCSYKKKTNFKENYRFEEK